MIDFGHSAGPQVLMDKGTRYFESAHDPLNAHALSPGKPTVKLLLLLFVALLICIGCSRRPARPAIEDSFADRRSFLMATALAGGGVELVEDNLELPRVDDPINLYGAYSAALLRLGFHKEAANKTIRRIAEWFEHPHPRGRDHRGEVDFAAIEMARTYVSLKDSPVLEEQTKRALAAFFTNYDFQSMYASENHDFVFHAARYLMAGELPAELFKAYGKKGSELKEIDLGWLKEFIRYRAKYGWGEFDAGGYQALVFNTLLTLRDLAPDQDLADLADKKANVLLLDMMVDSLHGLYAGARGRLPESDVLGHGKTVLHDLKYLYFGLADSDPEESGKNLLNAERMSRWEPLNYSLFSEFRPLPIAHKIVLERTLPYTSRERKHLHNMNDTLPLQPLDGSIRKTTFMAGEYALGAIQYQDPYPEHAYARYAKHQQHEWDFTVRRGLKTRIFTHHPGNSGMHTYWRGNDWRDVVTTFQHGNVVLARWNLPQGVPFPFIHAYLPRQEFDEVFYREGWVFARAGDVFSALHMTGGMEWTTTGEWANKEIVSRGLQVASVFECGTVADFGSFADFQEAVLETSIDFDPTTMRLRYQSAKSGVVEITEDGRRLVDGRPYDLNYKLYESPYMQSEWGSGVITLRHGNEAMTLNFN